VNQGVWEKLGFIVEAEGTILCLMAYLIPGLYYYRNRMIGWFQGKVMPRA
jgi:hypothetical protein